MLKFLKSRSNFKVKITKSKIMVTIEKSYHNENTTWNTCMKVLSLAIQKITWWSMLKILQTNKHTNRRTGKKLYASIFRYLTQSVVQLNTAWFKAWNPFFHHLTRFVKICYDLAWRSYTVCYALPRIETLWSKIDTLCKALLRLPSFLTHFHTLLSDTICLERCDFWITQS
jgi:hypothetical protein